MVEAECTECGLPVPATVSGDAVDLRRLLVDVSALLAERYNGPGVDELRARVDATLDAHSAPVTGHGETLRTLLGSVAAGRVSPEDAARLIESWPQGASS